MSHFEIPRPKESSLTDKITRAVYDEILDRERKTLKKLEEMKRGPEEKKLGKDEIARKTEETRNTLEQTYNRLGIAQILEEIRDNIWRDGIVENPRFMAFGPDEGSITSGLEFSYPTATKGRWNRTNAYGVESTDYSPKIYTRTENLAISIDLNKKNKPEEHIYFKGHQIPIKPGGDAEAIEQLEELIANDFKDKILTGRFPLSVAMDKGQEKIKSVRAFAKNRGLRIIDER